MTNTLYITYDNVTVMILTTRARVSCTVAVIPVNPLMGSSELLTNYYEIIRAKPESFDNFWNQLIKANNRLIESISKEVNLSLTSLKVCF